jgi:F-type H+-transporting ATPase subunit b
MNLKILLPILLVPILTFASGSEHGVIDHGGVPKVVLYQAINVLIIFLMGYWLARHKVTAFFKEKRKKYIEAQNKSKQALISAQNDHHEVKTRLDKLKSNKLDTLSKAKADASDLRKQILNDAELMAKRLENEAELAAKIELQRAKNELRDALLKEAFILSKRDISSKTTADDQKRLQKEFISKVEVAQ